MPITVTREITKSQKARLQEAVGLLSLEFSGLTNQEAYRLAFSRLLKPDPLDRVSMMGTDQRDLFVTMLSDHVKSIPERGHYFDFGGGDGQTFALVAGSVPQNVTVHIEEPDGKYLEDYVAYVEAQPHLNLGHAIQAGFDQMTSTETGITIQKPEAVDAASAIHMIYFLPDLEKSLKAMYNFLKPGGSLFIVFADERAAHTGQAVQYHYKKAGYFRKAKAHRDICNERYRLLGPRNSGGGHIEDILRQEFPGTIPELESTILNSRLYGHTLADIVALGFITELAPSDDTTILDHSKLVHCVELIEKYPEKVDFRIEDEGIRTGMYSVTQPQIVTVIKRIPLKNVI
ncbi:MAG: methyltransferase domain-containing protein [Deltaproteobacteria bacterium]|nr:MAG: methyltransferase domain-containing protein [Deltaproteobacteria bacterium]